MIHIKPYLQFFESTEHLNEAAHFSRRKPAAIAYILGVHRADDSPTENENRLIYRKYGLPDHQIMNMIFGDGWKRREYSLWIDDLAAKMGVPVSALNRIINKMGKYFIDVSMGREVDNRELPQYFMDLYNSSLEHIKKIIESEEAEEYGIPLDPPFNILRPTIKELGKRTKTFTLWDYPNEEDKTLEDIKYMRFGEDLTRKMIRTGVINSKLDLVGYDLIASPLSSSKILPIFIEEILVEIERQQDSFGMAKKLPKVSAGAFEKLKWRDAEWYWNKIENLQPRVKIELESNIDKIMRNIPGEKVKFQGGPLHKRYRYLVDRFMRLTETGKSDIPSGSRILLVDDFVTGGNTQRQMEKITLEANPSANVFGLGIFKIKSPDTENIR